jgi:hypothetical protein
MGGVFDHSRADPAVVPCQTCHTDNNSINARGKGSAPTPHVATTLDCGICHNTTSFATAIFDHSTIVAGTRCDSCHNGTDAKGMPTNGTHLTPINGDDCDVCHTSPGGTFTTGIFVHSTAYLTAYQCMDCHNDVIAGGKTVDHIPTTDDCGVCHTTAIDTNTGLGVSFKGATVDHSGLTSGCAVCHNGATAIDQPATHVPTPNGVDCSVCHSTGGTVTPAPFAPANNFAHQASTITAGCTSCHNGKYKLADNTVVKTKPSGTHIPAIDDCGVCHDSTSIPDGFKSAALFVNNVHPPITKGCGGCHTGQFPPALGKSDTPAAHTPHVPTSQDCNLCHNNVDFSVSLFQHTGISNKCSTCHDGTYATSANALGKPANHVVTSADCGACHNIKADFTGGYVDHTGPQVTGAGILCESCHDGNTPGVLGKKDAVPTHEVTSLDCIACHSPGGSFATAVFDHSTLTADTRCDSCHGVTSIGKDAKTNPPHVTTDLDCRVCHNTDSFASAQYDHTTIDSDCGVCHDGVSATGKITNHVPTNLDCAICHVTAGFKPATFSHAPNQINSTCSSCHDGVFATGKTTNHIATSATSDCGDCHSTDTFLGATYDHTGVVSGCAASGCHDGNSTGVKGMPTGHLVTTLDCHYCHTAGGSFVTLVWDHRNNTSECKSCHDKTGSGYINSVYNIAPLKPSGHFVTTAECIECHTTSAWLPNANFKHSATSNYPGDHSTRRVSTCDQCHTSNNQNITYPYSTYAPDCAACHANRYKSGDHGGRSVSTNANCGKSGCHRVSSSSF